MSQSNISQLSVNTIRTLSIDAVQQVRLAFQNAIDQPVFDRTMRVEEHIPIHIALDDVVRLSGMFVENVHQPSFETHLPSFARVPSAG